MTTTLSRTIRVHRPVVPSAPAAPVELAPRAGVPEGARLLLVDNGKPRARDLLGMLGEEVQRLLPIGSVEMVSKPSAASPLSDEEAAEIAKRVDLVVTGLGDCGACSACSLHDALLFERAGVPATVLITDAFVSHVARFAANLGAPGYHSLVVPHPAATKTDEQLRHLALSVAPAAREQLSALGASSVR
jgi:hypothetical protein